MYCTLKVKYDIVLMGKIIWKGTRAMAGKGKRYSDEGTLNYKKIFAVFIFIAVVIMFVFGIKKIIYMHFHMIYAKII